MSAMYTAFLRTPYGADARFVWQRRIEDNLLFMLYKAIRGALRQHHPPQPQQTPYAGCFTTPPHTLSQEDAERQDGDECSMCLDVFQAAQACRELPACGHLFHEDCIADWAKNKKSCPNCRADLDPDLFVSS